MIVPAHRSRRAGGSRDALAAAILSVILLESSGSTTASNDAHSFRRSHHNAARALLTSGTCESSCIGKTCDDWIESDGATCAYNMESKYTFV